MKDANGPTTLEPDLDELRTILLGLDHDVVHELHRRVANPTARAIDVAEVLPEALARAAKPPESLGVVARPVVESALDASVRRDPASLGEILFPVMGPAIRRAVSEAIHAFMRSLNQGLEHAVSFKSIRWRFEAWRTGKSFGEVVLRHTFRFRVEQVFLIHKETGLLLQHVVQPALAVADADVVSSMLYAIQDFVHDSFRVESDGSLEQIEMGDLTIWIEGGPRALLAAVVRGTAPMEYRDRLEETVEHVHAKYSASLQQFSGDTAPFQSAEPLLAECLSEEFEDGAGPSLWRAYLVAAVTLVLIGGLAYWWLQERARWQQAMDALRREPGIVIVSADRGIRRHHIAGLRDPYAADPSSVLARAGLDPGVVDAEWRPFQSGDAVIAERRAVALLRPPPEVNMAVGEGVLRVSGRASASWTQELLRVGRFIAGIDAIDTSALIDLEQSTLEQDRRQLSPFTVEFAVGAAALQGDGLEALTQYAVRLAELARRASGVGSRLEVLVVGSSDPLGDTAPNLQLARRRAAFVQSALVAAGVPGDVVRTDVVPPGARASDDAAAGAAGASQSATVTIRILEAASFP